MPQVAAGYSAEDFRNAGYLAERLIYDADYWANPEMTPGELQWEETYAFFSAEELKTAGYIHVATDLHATCSLPCGHIS